MFFSGALGLGLTCLGLKPALLGCGPLAHRIQSSEVLETLVPAKVLEQKNVVESVKDEPDEIYSLVSEALNSSAE